MNDSGAEGLSRAVVDLRSVIPFDSAQVIRHDPRSDRSREVIRLGYGAASSWALQHLFIRRYGIGFTHWMSPLDGLPPSISDVPPSRRQEFMSSEVYREYLRVDGYRDGMSVELFSGNQYVGLAHFSSRDNLVYTQKERKVASSVSGLLAAAIQNSTEIMDAQDRVSWVDVSGNSPPFFRGAEEFGIWRFDVRISDWCAVSGTRDAPWREDPLFLRHLELFSGNPDHSARHLWTTGKSVYAISLTKLPSTGQIEVRSGRCTAERYWGLSLQELRVASLMCLGKTDEEIAVLMNLSPRTVHSHTTSTRRKMGVRSRVEAAVRIITTASFLPDPRFASLAEFSRALKQ